MKVTHVKSYNQKQPLSIATRSVVVLIVWKLDLQLSVQSVFITTIAVSSNPVHGELYWIDHYGIKFVSYLRQVGGFLRVLR